MKRDLNLIREIMLALEDVSVFPLQTAEVCELLNTEDYLAVNEHLKMLASAGLISGRERGWVDGRLFLFDGITYDGHDFIEQIRNDTVFNKAVSHIKEYGLPVALNVLSDICSKIALGKL